MLRTDDLDYDLPEGCIATMPAEPRDSARLLVVSRSDASLVHHAFVRDLPSFLAPRDLLVVNSTKVLPAMLTGWRVDTMGEVEGLYLRPGPGPQRQWALMLQGRRMKEGVVVGLRDAHGDDSGLRLTLQERVADEPGAWVAHLGAASSASAPLLEQSDEAILHILGKTPLPPYIRKARERAGNAVDDAYDRARYQTVYAHARENQASGGASEQVLGSVAAPTAGLHLTPNLLAMLTRMGVRREEVVLHVGTGTFKSVETAFVELHAMHSERCWLSPGVREAILATRGSTSHVGDGGGARGRVVCVGTTAARTVESFAALASEQDFERVQTTGLDTRLLITPGYAWRWTDALLTNFHLPRSTLLAMVSSLLAPDASGVARLKELYRLAIARGYRFYSYGDAMLVLP